MTEQSNTKITASILARVLSFYPTKKEERNKYPKWFRLLNNILLLPILLWPLIFYGSIFVFDDPANTGYALWVFLLMNSYPLWLLLISTLSYTLYRKIKTIGIVIPFLFIAVCISLLYFVFK